MKKTIRNIFEDVELGSPGDHLDSLKNLKNELCIKYKRLAIINSYLTVRLEGFRRDEMFQRTKWNVSWFGIGSFLVNV